MAQLGLAFVQVIHLYGSANGQKENRNVNLSGTAAQSGSCVRVMDGFMYWTFYRSILKV